MPNRGIGAERGSPLQTRDTRANGVETTAQQAASFLGSRAGSLQRASWNQEQRALRAGEGAGLGPMAQALRTFSHQDRRLQGYLENHGVLYSPEGREMSQEYDEALEAVMHAFGVNAHSGGRDAVDLESLAEGFRAVARAAFPEEPPVPAATEASSIEAGPDEEVGEGESAESVTAGLATVPTMPLPHAAPAVGETIEPEVGETAALGYTPYQEPPRVVPVVDQLGPAAGQNRSMYAADADDADLAPTELRGAVHSDTGVAERGGYSQEPTQPRVPAAAGETDRSGAEEPFGRSVELTQDNLDRAWNIINGMDPSSPQRDEDMAQLLHMLQGDFKSQLFAPENIDLILPQVRVIEQSLQRIGNRALRPRQIEVLMDIARRGSEDDFIFMLRLTDESLRRAVFKNVRGRVSEASRNIWTAQLEHDQGFLTVYENEYTSMSELAVRINNLMPDADRKQDRDITYSSVRDVEALGTRFVNLVQSLPDDTSLSSRTIIDIVTEEVRLGLYRDINDAIEGVESACESTEEYPDDILPMLQAVRQGVVERLYVSHFDIAEDMRLLTSRDDRRVGTIVLFERLREEGISPSDVGLTPEVLASYYTLNETERPMPTVYDAGVAFEDQAAAIVGKRPAHRLLTGMKNRLLSVSPEFIDSDMDAFIEEWVDVLGSPQERRHPLNATQQMRLRGLMYSFQAELRRDSIFVQGVDGEVSILERVQEAQTINDLGTQVITIGRKNEGEAFKLYVFDLVDALRAYAESSADAIRDTSIAQQRQQFLDAVGLFVKRRGQPDQTAQRPKGRSVISRLVSAQRAPARDPLQQLYALDDADREQVVTHLERFVEYDDYDYLIDAYLVGLQEVREKEADAREQESQPSALREMDLPEQVAVSRAQPGSSGRQPRPGQTGRGFASSRWGELGERVLNTNAATGTNGPAPTPRPAASYNPFDNDVAYTEWERTNGSPSSQVGQPRHRDADSRAGGVRPGSSRGHARPSIAPPPMPPGAHEPPQGRESITSTPPVDDFDAFMRGVSTGPSTRDADTHGVPLGQVRPRKKRNTRDWIN